MAIGRPPQWVRTLAMIPRLTAPYIYSIFLAFGVTGCLLSILLFSRRKFRTVTCCICKFSCQRNQNIKDTFNISFYLK